MQKAFCVLLLVLAFVFRADAQATATVTSTFSNTNSNTNSWTPTNSNSVSPSNSLTGSNSGSNSVSGTRPASVSVTRSAAPTTSNSWTATPSWTQTVPSPPAPVGLVNRCLNHIVNICPSWSNPPGIVFQSFNLIYRVTGTVTPPNVISVRSTSGRVTSLLPATSYDFNVEGILNGVTSLLSTTSVFVTAAADPKLVKTRDITNIACTNVKSATTRRSVILCTWTAALDPVLELRVKAHCQSPIREPNEVRKHYFGSRALATTITLNLNRDVATCEVFIKARYARRPASRHHLTVIMAQ